MKNVSLISLTPIKGCALLHPDEVRLTEAGAVENRRFFLARPDGTRLRSSKTPWPVRIEARYDAESDVLRMRFADGTEVEGEAKPEGEPVVSKFYGNRRVESQRVPGPWTELLSDAAGHPVALLRPFHPGECFEFPVSLMSEASVARLSEQAGRSVDGRRFRMLFTLAGLEAHEEDDWDGRRLRVGEAVLRVGGPIARCAVTTRDPDTGKRDLDTLRLIKDYRGVREGEVDFGVYATVEEPGVVRAGDPAELEY